LFEIMDKQHILKVYTPSVLVENRPPPLPDRKQSKTGWTFADDTDLSYPLSPAVVSGAPLLISTNSKEPMRSEPESMDALSTPKIAVVKEKNNNKVKSETKQKWNRWLRNEDTGPKWEIEELWTAPSVEDEAKCT
jgi:hypothetical protein